MLWLDLIQPCNYVCYCYYALFYGTYCLKVRYLSFIHSWDNGSWKLPYSCDFNILVFLGFTYRCHIAFHYFELYINFIISCKLLLLIIIIIIVIIIMVIINIFIISMILFLLSHSLVVLLLFLCYSFFNFYFTVITFIISITAVIFINSYYILTN